MTNIVLPDAGQRSLAFYLAMEEFVARNFEGEAFFVWQSEPTVIFGRNQVLENEVNMEYCSRNGIEVVRRKSGGGCVYSDKGNIMISFISRRGDVAAVFDRYLSALTACLCSLGTDACRSGRNDILVGGRKVSGNAFHQLPDRSIVHGTLLHSTDFTSMEQALMPPVEKLQRHGVESVRQRVMNLSEVLPLGLDDVKDALVEHFCEDSVVLEDADLAAIEILQKDYFVLPPLMSEKSVKPVDKLYY